jgi:hypothetical protein
MRSVPGGKGWKITEDGIGLTHFIHKYLAAFILLLSLTWWPHAQARACTDPFWGKGP